MMKTQRYKAFAAMFLAGAGLGTAAVTYVDPPDIPIPADLGGVYLDLNIGLPSGSTESGAGSVGPGGEGLFTLSYSEPATGDWDVNFFFGGTGIVHNTTFQPYRADPADNLSAIHNVGLNTNIDGAEIALEPGSLPSAPLTTPDFGGSGTTTGTSSLSHMGGLVGQFASGIPLATGTPGYIGFVLDPGPSEQYGWIEVTFNDADDTGGIIHRWAYTDDPINDSIPVGVPEPGTVMLALLGALGLIVRRRR